MRVMEIAGAWGLKHLGPATRPDPVPGPGQVVVRIEAASVNYRDLVVAGRGYGRRTGELPLVPVSDGAGTVVATGPGVTRAAVGDLVCPAFAQTWLAGPLRDEHWAGMLGGPATACSRSSCCRTRTAWCARRGTWTRSRRRPCPAPA